MRRCEMENTFFATLFREIHFPLGTDALQLSRKSGRAFAGGRVPCACARAHRQPVFGKSYDCGAVCVKAMYHDAPEILTGDLPTPVKYYSPETKKAYDTVENAAKARFAAKPARRARVGYATCSAAPRTKSVSSRPPISSPRC